MEHILGKDWTITPAGGSTGEAYYAHSERKRLFLKRNSSPFLAVLSAEGIVPKLVWTKRLENGDVITAQQWLEGRELSPEEMKHPRVAKMLSKIHHSSELLDMLMRIEVNPINPNQMLASLKQQIKEDGVTNARIEIHQALKYLDRMTPYINSNHQVVCHCDMNHNNWLLSNDDQLYLIDWDNARVGDPAMDIGTILLEYIPEDEWDDWLDHYGATKDQHLLNRMYWYLIVRTITYYIWNGQKGKNKEAAHQLNELKRLIKKVN
ncbi:phosphotransferase family protein [Aquibacillus sediminis]|uniref:phosphotransferase n=1 Tax=Aquibacillus sediminis TaxID=2574734 RepID=UPI001FE6EE5D|nr:phosphotransferase family protein [Aquibacillus sediminis]